MRPISAKVRKELEADKRMKRCALWNLQSVYGACSGRVQWHHVWMYAGKQIDEPWAIVGACEGHHAMVTMQQAVRMAFEAVSLALATAADLAKYPRKNWAQIKQALGLTE